MLLQDLFETLSLYDFSQHGYGITDSAGTIIEPHTLIPAINLGLRELHKRFLIKKGVVHVCLDPCIRRYCIDDCDREYLIYEDKPLRLLEILEVISCDGLETRLNATHRKPPCDNSCTVEIFMPQFNVLEFSAERGLFRVHYRRDANPVPNPKYIAEWDARAIEVDIPDAYCDALAYYVAMRVFGVTTPVDGGAAAYSPALQYKAKFDEECQRLATYNFEVDGAGNHQQRFRDSGMP